MAVTEQRRPTLAEAIGVNVPLDGVSLADHRSLVDSLVEAGYRQLWTGEVNGSESAVTLAYFAGRYDELTFGSAVMNAFTRSPSLIAMTAATLGDLAPGRMRVGLGAGSRVIVEEWNGIAFDRPYTRVAEVLAYTRDVLRDGHSTRTFTTINPRGFQLARRPDVVPELIIGAGGPRMTRLAAEHADGVMFNFVAPQDIRFLASQLELPERSHQACRLYVRLFVFPDQIGADAEFGARRLLSGYMTAPGYRSFQEWLGRADDLTPLWRAWDAGDRRGATQAIPRSVIDSITIVGDSDRVADTVAEYLEAGASAVTLRLGHGPNGRLSPPDTLEFLTQVASSYAAHQRREETNARRTERRDERGIDD